MMEQEIIRCEERLLLAMKNSDISDLKALIHDNLLFSIPSGDIITKETLLATYGTKRRFDNMDCLKRKINLFGDTAIVHTSIYIKGSFVDTEMDAIANFLRTWKKTDGYWKLIAGCSLGSN